MQVAVWCDKEVEVLYRCHEAGGGVVTWKWWSYTGVMVQVVVWSDMEVEVLYRYHGAGGGGVTWK